MRDLSSFVISFVTGLSQVTFDQGCPFCAMEDMPPDDPNKRLSDQQYVDLLAFLLSANKIPAGTAALDADRNGLAQITFLAKKDTGSRFKGGW